MDANCSAREINEKAYQESCFGSFSPLKDGEWILLDDIVYKFNSEPNFDIARTEFLKSIRQLISCDCATFFLVDRSHKYSIGSPLGDGISDYALREYIEMQMDQDYARWLFSTPHGRTYKTSEWFPPGKREAEPYYREYYKKYGLHYAVLLTLTFNDEFVGIVALYRSSEGPDFDAREMFLLDTFRRHLSLRVYKEVFLTNCYRPGIFSIIDANKEKIVHLYGLTPKEQQVTLLMLEGAHNERICQELSIKNGTLKSHIRNIYKKLHIRRRAEMFNMFISQDY